VSIIKLAESLPNTRTGRHFQNQLLKSGTSPAPNSGEAQGAESRSDFIHKLKMALKELRETKVWLLIIDRTELMKSKLKLVQALAENEELISIIFKSIETAQKRRNMQK
jgi:four helix bundle protein